MSKSSGRAKVFPPSILSMGVSRRIGRKRPNRVLLGGYYLKATVSEWPPRGRARAATRGAGRR
eukprot:SAG22_NODE_14547_length_371_cov_31.172794_1_plen_62_part_10